MSFIKHIPYGDRKPSDLWTTCQSEVQLWQELTMLRHVTGANEIYARETTASYIDQAKVYFLDAANSNWRSAGLLYYYSFLNLAKAYLVTNRAISGRTLKSSSIYHGLTAAPQNPTNITNFDIQIHPPGQNNKRNIFSNFYQKLVQEPWPFNQTISIKISDIVSYCDDISHEVSNFYNIQRELIDVLSITRKEDNNFCLELLIPNNKVPIIQTEIGHAINSVKNYGALSDLDKTIWITSHNITAGQLQNHSLVQLNRVTFNAGNENQQFNKLIADSDHLFKGLILPTSSHNFELNLFWHFVPKITLNSTTVKWHPLLSNYLFAFMLSSVLRYQPHLFALNSKESFIAEAWCNQSASTSLRYFLMALSKHNIRIN
jgi:hypothetical protein